MYWKNISLSFGNTQLTVVEFTFNELAGPCSSHFPQVELSRSVFCSWIFFEATRADTSDLTNIRPLRNLILDKNKKQTKSNALILPWNVHPLYLLSTITRFYNALIVLNYVNAINKYLVNARSNSVRLEF